MTCGNHVDISLILTPFHQAQKAGILRGSPTAAAVEADLCIHRGYCVHLHRDHTAEAFHQHQAYRPADLSPHSTLGNFKHRNAKP